MKKLAILLFFAILPVTYAMIINVEIEDIVNGRSSYHNFNNSSIVSFSLDWENIGSVDCNARLRMDIQDLNSSELHIVWSKKEVLAPGGGALLSTYYLPKKSGNYSATIKLYYCNDIYTISNFNFSFEKPEFKKLNLSLDVATTKNEIKFKIKPKKDLDKLYIIPEKYPRGWIFDSLEVKNLKKSKEKEVTLTYIPAYWMPRDITFSLISGNYLKNVKIKLEEEKKLPVFEIVITLLAISLFVNFYLVVRGKNKKELI